MNAKNIVDFMQSHKPRSTDLESDVDTVEAGGTVVEYSTTPKKRRWRCQS